MPVCKQCKWFQCSQGWDPREGECKPPRGKASNPEFGGPRHPAKFVRADQDASNCPDFERADWGGKRHDAI